MPKGKLDLEEREILESFESGEWESVEKETVAKYQNMAKESLKKDKRINIRISGRDLDRIQRKAAHEGIPYQTLVGSILHKYANDYLKEAI